MTSFLVTTDGTVKVKPIKNGRKGRIYYKFKGRSMQSEQGTVVDFDPGRITVKRDKDNFLSNFVWKHNHWLLENNTTNKSLLYGTEFILSDVDEKNI
jgi:hypothetical protein